MFLKVFFEFLHNDEKQWEDKNSTIQIFKKNPPVGSNRPFGPVLAQNYGILTLGDSF